MLTKIVITSSSHNTKLSELFNKNSYIQVNTRIQYYIYIYSFRFTPGKSVLTTN